MRLSAVALFLIGSGLLTGCSSSPSCEDVDDLTSRLAATSRDDSDYYDIQDQLNQALSDCNS